MGDLREGKDMTPKLIGDTYMKYATKNSRQRNRFGIYECQYCNKEFEWQPEPEVRGSEIPFKIKG